MLKWARHVNTKSILFSLARFRLLRKSIYTCGPGRADEVSRQFSILFENENAIRATRKQTHNVWHTSLFY